ncbi:sterol desaturase family protein [Rhodovibrionaceae bacterium A322]
MEMSDLAGRNGGLGLLALVVGAIALEAFWLLVIKRQSYDWKATCATFGVSLGRRGIKLLTTGLVAGLFFWVYQYRLFTLTLDSAASVIALFFCFEFAYYWQHRLAHEVRWFWANHVVHHSPSEMNLSVSLRLGWTGFLTGNALFYAPLCLLGFHPVAVFLALAANLFYQVWIHTELVRKLPRPFEFIFNTPSHHRVHHACNGRYLDKNYGGVLIIWDRLFGTFEAEEEKPVYGLTTPLTSYNPFVIALREWKLMALDVWRADGWQQRLAYLFAPPGWSPTAKRRMSRLRLVNPFRPSS